MIGSRLEELFELILEDLYATGIRDLPGGIVITGGTAKLDGILQLARDVFETRARLSHQNILVSVSRCILLRLA